MAQNIENNSSIKRGAPSVSNPSSSIPQKPNITGVFKVEKVGPIFRIVNPYEVKKEVKPVKPAQNSAKENEEAFEAKRKRGDLYADDTGPYWHKVTHAMTTPPIITSNLPLMFKDLPMTGAPVSSSNLEAYEHKALREYVGCDLDDAEFEELENYCNPDNLKTGKEIKTTTRMPVPGFITKNIIRDLSDSDEDSNPETNVDLCTLKKQKARHEEAETNGYPRFLKYRGVKLMPLADQEQHLSGKNMEPADLEPGKDVLFRIRIYRPFTFCLTGEKHVRSRHSVFNCDIVVTGRQTMAALRDRFTCRNDLDLRLDVSDRPDEQPLACARKVFPSGFLFINNVFYVDGRAGCRDMSASLRRWAAERGLGDFPVRRMEDCRLDSVPLRLGHPEVYVHQGSCEHLFLFSEARLVARSDPLQAAAYPRHSAISQNQTIYCTTCAEFGARWLVAGSRRVPFDPAFFCEVCFKQYLYRDGRKIGDFRAYAYRGNELNLVAGTAKAGAGKL